MRKIVFFLPLLLSGCMAHQHSLRTIGCVAFFLLVGVEVAYSLLEGRIMRWREARLIIAFQWVALGIILAGCGTTQYVAVPQIKQPESVKIKPVIIACPPLQKATQDNFLAVIVHNYEVYNACRDQTNNVIMPYFEKVK